MAAGQRAVEIDVAGSGLAGGGGALPGTARARTYRRAGRATWTSAGPGTSTTISLPYAGSNVNQCWGIRPIASEGALDSEPAIVTVQRPPD